VRHREHSTLEAAMERYADGHDDALPLVYTGVAPRIRQYSQRRVNDDAAADVVAYVMTELHRNRSLYITGAPVLPWAFSFARVRLAELEADRLSKRTDDEATITGPLRDQVRRLDEPLRTTLEFVLLEGFTPSVAADLLGTNVRTIQAWTRRGFEKLDDLGHESDETDEIVPYQGKRHSHARVDTDPALCGTLAGKKYRIGNEIGAGGMAVVYEAQDLDTGREVAIKVMKEGRDATEIQRFANEFEALYKFRKNKNIVEVFEEGNLRDGQCFYVMERLYGRTLKDELAGVKRLEWNRVARIVGQICEALKEVHANGFVHRDIKPANIFLVHDDKGCEVVKLIDFGIVRGNDVDPQEQLTRPGTIPGTFAYLSPERAKSQGADARSDVYSIGITMFEALAGRRPFFVSGDGFAELAGSLTKPPPAMRKICPTVPFTDQVEAIVRKALEFDPDDRFRDVSELANAVNALDGKGRGDLPFNPRPRARERVRAALVGASAAMTIGTLAVAGLFADNRDRLPSAGLSLSDEHIDAGLTSIAELLTRCHAPNEDAPTQPMRVTFTVLGATGEVIEAKAHAADPDSQPANCIQDAMYRARFNTFGASKQSIERDL
jgi:serine/threonine protein kinase/DNA-directed RNA polymerase specialized sigma24 family protein